MLLLLLLLSPASSFAFATLLLLFGLARALILPTRAARFGASWTGRNAPHAAAAAATARLLCAAKETSNPCGETRRPCFHSYATRDAAAATACCCTCRCTGRVDLCFLLWARSKHVFDGGLLLVRLGFQGAGFFPRRQRPASGCHRRAEEPGDADVVRVLWRGVDHAGVRPALELCGIICRFALEHTSAFERRLLPPSVRSARAQSCTWVVRALFVVRVGVWVGIKRARRRCGHRRWCRGCG